MPAPPLHEHSELAPNFEYPSVTEAVHFHSYRDGNATKPPGLYDRLWALQEGTDAGGVVKHALREHIVWRVRRALSKTAPVSFSLDELKRVLPSNVELPSASSAREAVAWLCDANDRLSLSDGGWRPHPFATYAATGHSVEETALRIPAYLELYESFADERYLERATAAGRYLRNRVDASGHVLLQGHTVIDLPYAFAIHAFLSLFERTRSAEWLDVARLVGRRLRDYHIAGSVNHTVCPAGALARLFRATGDDDLLSAAIGRIEKMGMWSQLANGGWAGHERWSWYHGIILRSFIETYAALPVTLKFQPKRDRLANAILGGLTRFARTQRPDGTICAGPSGDEYDELDEYGGDPRSGVIVKQKAAGGWTRAPGTPLEHYGYEAECLLRFRQLVGSPLVDAVSLRLASAIFESRTVWRFEFTTQAIGAAVGLIRCIREARGWAEI